MTEPNYATVYSSKPEAYLPLLEQLEELGYELHVEDLPDVFMLDPSIQKGGSDHVWQGEMNLARFVLEEQRTNSRK